MSVWDGQSRPFLLPSQPRSSVILARRETYRKSPDIPCVSSRPLGLWRQLIRILEPKSVRFGPQSQFESLQFPFLQRAADQRLICSTLRPGSTMALLT